MADAAIAADLYQSLDILADLLAQLAFYGEILIDELANTRDLVIGQVSNLSLDRDAG